MIFNSVTYLIFLIIIIPLFWFLPRMPRLIMVFLSSIAFYSFWDIKFVPLLLLSTINDFWISKKIYSSKNNVLKRRLLILSILLNLFLLFIFKYLFFAIYNVNGLFNLFGLEISIPQLKLILPLGISFYTFQTISYSVDVYRGHIKPEKSFITYCCYVMFFPQLVAGPILRASEVINQLKNRKIYHRSDLIYGIERILYGLFLKTVLADNIAPLVDKGFIIDSNKLSGIDVWTLSFLFGFQIYFDFSAYSHIAIGSARLMGIYFPENFNFPYAATSLKDFWKRWHISLSSWIRDYLYLPLMGLKVHNSSLGGLPLNVKVSKSKKSFSLFVTWAIMGLWHGANWTFVFWGIYHATLIYLERTLSKIIKIPLILKSCFGLFLTLPLIMLSWIPFRAESLNDSFIMFSKLLIFENYFSLGMRENTYLITFSILMLFFLRYIYCIYLNEFINKFKTIYFMKETLVYTILIIFCFVFLRPIRQFIYFQF